MSDTLINSLIAPAALMIIGAIIGFIKYMFAQQEKKQQLETEERNKRRDQIEAKLAELERDNRVFQSAMLACDNPNCKAKPIIVEYFNNKLK